MMKKYILCLFSMMFFLLSVLRAEDYVYTAPELMQSAYRSYSQNFPFASLLGKGNTGVAETGGLPLLNRNPASLNLQATSFNFGLLMKSNAESLIKEEANKNYKLNPLLGTVSLGFPLNDKMNFGVTYLEKKSIVMKSIKLHLKTGVNRLREPEYTQQDIVMTLNYNFGKFKCGLNVINEYHYVYSQRNYQDIWSNLKDKDTVFRFQPGILYEYGNFSFGLTYKTEAKAKFNLLKWKPPHQENIFEEKYNTTLPFELAGGINFKPSKTLSFNLETEYIKTSDENSANDDLLNVKFGLEKEYKDFRFRIGYMRLPQAYSGKITVPYHQETLDEYNSDDEREMNDGNGGNNGTSEDYDQPDPDLTIIENNRQMLTCGFGYFHKYGDLNIAVAGDVKSKNTPAQFVMNFGFNLNKVKKAFANKAWLKSD
ncbi:MAG: hypothetical protein CSB55_03295 [Candidatus Cloacimonadota bacterium]|nr:MAG: hypothetical protein CSB55_03295 [Candidatus Cloacimonadota bacterium]